MRPRPAITRAELYEILQRECTYQTQEPYRPPTVGEALLLMEQYLTEARVEWAKEAPPELHALGKIRQLAAVALLCIEQHGAPHRQES